MTKKFDIIIVGGGTIGLASGLALSLKGFKVLILDNKNPPVNLSHDFDGRNIALNNASVRFFENIGIWDNLKDKAQPIHDIIVSDGDLKYGASEKFLHFDAQDINREAFGYFVLNPDIHNALIDHAKKQTNITLKHNISVKNIIATDTFTQIIDSDDTVYEALLLIAADGKNSFVRNHFDIPLYQKDYGQTAIVLAVSHEKQHLGIAQEFFLPAGPFAILPLADKQQSSLVWVENHQFARALLNACDDVFFYELKRRFGDYLGDIKIISKKFSYPLKLQITKSVIAPRTIFVGDASHVIHPISGQGFNLGIRDIGFIFDIIQKHSYAGLDIGSNLVLKEYKNIRQNDIELFGNMTTALNWLFSNDNFILQKSRRLGLNIVNHLPNLRNFFAQAASAGSINHLPSMLNYV